MLEKLKHWKYQIMLGAPVMPWLAMQYGDWLRTVALGFGWGETTASVIPAFLTLGMTVALFVAFVKFHENDD